MRDGIFAIKDLFEDDGFMYLYLKRRVQEKWIKILLSDGKYTSTVAHKKIFNKDYMVIFSEGWLRIRKILEDKKFIYIIPIEKVYEVDYFEWEHIIEAVRFDFMEELEKI